MVDDIVGRILEKLEKLEIDGDTLFVFTSDNGSENSYPQFGHEPSYRYRGHKSDIWDGGHRIPYIVRWQGHIAPDSTTDQTVSLSDLFATFAEILDIRVQNNEAEDSVSNLSLWLGQDSPVWNHTVSSSGNGMFAIRKGKWKLDMCPGYGGFDEGPDVDKLPPVQLYDMEQDVGETTNLCNEHPEIVASLTELLTKTVIDGRSTPGTPQKNTGPEWWSQLTWLEQP